MPMDPLLEAKELVVPGVRRLVEFLQSVGYLDESGLHSLKPECRWHRLFIGYCFIRTGTDVKVGPGNVIECWRLGCATVDETQGVAGFDKAYSSVQQDLSGRHSGLRYEM